MTRIARSRTAGRSSTRSCKSGCCPGPLGATDMESPTSPPPPDHGTIRHAWRPCQPTPVLTRRITGAIDAVIVILIVATYFKAGFMIFDVQRLQSGVVPFTSLTDPRWAGRLAAAQAGLGLRCLQVLRARVGLRARPGGVCCQGRFRWGTPDSPRPLLPGLPCPFFAVQPRPLAPTCRMHSSASRHTPPTTYPRPPGWRAAVALLVSQSGTPALSLPLLPPHIVPVPSILL